VFHVLHLARFRTVARLSLRGQKIQEQETISLLPLEYRRIEQLKLVLNFNSAKNKGTDASKILAI
jgi:hypothetical protein